VCVCVLKTGSLLCDIWAIGDVEDRDLKLVSFNISSVPETLQK